MSEIVSGLFLVTFIVLETSARNNSYYFLKKSLTKKTKGKNDLKIPWNGYTELIQPYDILFLVFLRALWLLVPSPWAWYIRENENSHPELLADKIAIVQEKIRWQILSWQFLSRLLASATIYSPLFRLMCKILKFKSVGSLTALGRAYYSYTFLARLQQNFVKWFHTTHREGKAVIKLEMLLKKS